MKNVGSLFCLCMKEIERFHLLLSKKQLTVILVILMSCTCLNPFRKKMTSITNMAETLCGQHL